MLLRMKDIDKIIEDTASKENNIRFSDTRTGPSISVVLVSSIPPTTNNIKPIASFFSEIFLHIKKFILM